MTDPNREAPRLIAARMAESGSTTEQIVEYLE